MNAITQKHGSGCGVACVAYVLSISYDKALKLFEEPSFAWGRGFYCKEIVAALALKQRNYCFSKFDQSKKDLLSLPGTIVFVERSEKYPIGHYLVKSTDHLWMNPWANFPCISSAESAFQKRLPGNVSYIVYPCDE